MNADLETRLRRVEGRTAIEERIARYCFAIDARDLTALADCFTEDIEFRRQDRTFGQGREELMAMLVGFLKGFGPTWHVPFNNLVVDHTGDDTATSRHYGYAEHAIGEDLVVAAMTYHHDYRREADGQWRMSRRAIDFWYFCEISKLQRGYGTRDQLWWRGAPPPQFPADSPTYQAFVAEHVEHSRADGPEDGS